ncbi:MAG: hypothetical protein ACO3EZ_05305 [Prochlorotrichaceae cyanobacterium]
MFAPHTCPTCSDRLLRHIGSRGLYWRCSNCRENFDPNHPSLGAEVKRNKNRILCLSGLGTLEAAVLS